jgi:hypothetical protein
MSSTTSILSFPPNAVLRSVAGAMNCHDQDIVVQLPRDTTWKAATSAVLQALDEAAVDGPVVMFGPRSRQTREYLKRAALTEQKNSSISYSSTPLPLRNAVLASSLPDPKPMSSANRAKLKEMILKGPALDRDPYPIRLPPFTDEQTLAVIPGVLVLRGVEAADGEEVCRISNDAMLFDTGAQTSCITDDLLPASFVAYLDDPMHDRHRFGTSVKVHVCAAFAFGDQAPLDMDCIFTVVNKLNMPNQRSGIILGQHTLLESLQYRVVPRRVLQAQGRHVANGEWGDIIVDGYVDVDGRYISV